MRIIESYGEIRLFPPARALAPVWDSLSAVLRHYRVLNTDQDAVTRMQLDALRNGALLSPSIYGSGDDFSTESFYFPHVFAYLFRHQRGDYVWLTAQLDRGFGLGALILPGLDLAVALYPFSVNDDLLRRLASAHAGTDRPAPMKQKARARPRIITGHHHMMHVLWNELPAIDLALADGAIEGCAVDYIHQPVGPLDEIFPELRGRVSALPYDENAVVNGHATLIVGLGSWTIPTTTQTRLRATARRLSKPQLLTEMREFKDLHWPIFWLSVKPPNRSFLDQATIIAGLMARLRSTYPGAGFLLNGVGHPWDEATNPNYTACFYDTMLRASRDTADIIGQTYALLEPGVRNRTRVVSDIDILEEICWSGLADFYFCHGGSMQNKIAWTNDVSGVVHSNSSFIQSMKGMIRPTAGSAEVHFLPSSLVTDDDDSRYSSMDLARKDQNYTIGAIDDVADFILDRFRRSRG